MNSTHDAQQNRYRRFFLTTSLSILFILPRHFRKKNFVHSPCDPTAVYAGFQTEQRLSSEAARSRQRELVPNSRASGGVPPRLWKRSCSGRGSRNEVSAQFFLLLAW